MNDLVNIFKAFSDETRLRIIKLLEHGELCVCDLVAALDMVQPKVSFHLGVLKKAHLLNDRKQGKWMHYKIDDSDLFKRLIVLSVLEKIPDGLLEKDKARLKEFLQNKEEGRQAKQSADLCCSTDNKRRRNGEDRDTGNRLSKL